LPRSESRHVRSDTESDFQEGSQPAIVAWILANPCQIMPFSSTTNISLF
jgi:hypothetical protein